MPRYAVTLRLGKSHDLFLESQFLSGLADLARDDIIALRTEVSAPTDPQHRALIWLDVARGKFADRRCIVIDIADSANVLSQVGLDEAHFYWKRHYRDEALTSLSDEYRLKVRPFGLWMPCLSRSACMAHVMAAIQVYWDAGLFAPTAARQFARDLYLLYGLPSPSAFVADPERPREDLVVFQTRLWSPEDNKFALDVNKVNEERVAMVRRLRAVFGVRFMGGIVADNFSRVFAPEVVTNVATARRAYIRLTQRARAGVFTRGLHHTLGFRMPEYLAAGVAIVSEPIDDALLAPLVEGTHYRVYRTLDDCIAQCDDLLTNPDAAARITRANIQYFHDFCLPRNQMLRVLEQSY